ncbi:MAG: ExeM/NucH family extracellular endonuclease [Campylobacterota bacterium]|nr:ExeM/NucH family extracellular endonuclease [Campylobacterota bacterium]
MRKITLALSMLLGASSAFATCNDLFFSEYIEGGSYNKAIEIYNETGSNVDLTGYSLELYSNGGATPSYTKQLSGSVTNNDVFVVSHPSASDAIKIVTDLEASVINFNGDDTILLLKDGSVVDSIGQLNVDPGTQFGNSTVGTKDQTLVRNSGYCGRVDASSNFDPSLEWLSFAKDTFSELGSHNGNGGEDNGDEDIEEPLPSITKIHAIQGSADTTTMYNSEVTVEAVVTADYTTNGFKGFYIQEEDADADNNTATSEGVYVYCSNSCPTLSVGDLVQVTGTVTEYSNLTQIKNPTITTLSSQNALPAPVSLTLPVASVSDFEAVEGMIVTLNAGSEPLVVNEVYNLGRYGTFLVGSERLVQYTQTNTPDTAGYAAHQTQRELKSIEVDDGKSFQNPEEIIYPTDGLSYENTLRAGYTLNNITAVMDQRYGSHRLQPLADVNLEFMDENNPRVGVETKEFTRKDLRVASFNVLNYFNTFDNCTGGVNGDIMSCRGADDSLEFERQRVKIINAMLEIDADVYGLMEIENDGYGELSAIADLVNALNDAVGKNIYKFVNVDSKLETENALGTDAIKVAIIYNKKRINPRGTPHAVFLDENDKNRPSLIQKFKRRGAKRKDVFVVSVNHFKSKGSSCDSLTYEGIADVDHSDGAGNCNLTRTHASEVLTSYIATAKKLKRKKNVILLGDFNAYAKEDPIVAMENAGYTNIITDEYSYVYKGESGTLDYTMVSQNLAPKVRSVTVWHSNTDEPKVLDYNYDYKSSSQHETLYGDGVYRASDHDPIILDIKF